MNSRLTDRQRQIAMELHELIQTGRVGETFHVHHGAGWNACLIRTPATGYNDLNLEGVLPGEFHALAADNLLLETGKDRYTATRLLAEAVSTKFSPHTIPLSNPINSITSVPVDITLPLQRFQKRFPSPEKTGFLIMRFAAEKPYERIVTTIKNTAAEAGLTIVRADDAEFHRNLLSNIRTYLHGCGFGIAIYDRIKTNEPNANVGLEVGYLLAMNKPVLLLKDSTLPTLQADLAGELYKTFDPHNPEETIPGQMRKWFADYGITN